MALLEGSNATDREDWRPGSRAVAEQVFTSPLDEAGLSKEDVRSLARYLGLSVWDKPSFACLATRFPYGQAITPPLLERVGQAEQLLLDQGFSQVRVRIHDEGAVSRVEVPEGDIARAVHVLLECGLEAQLKELGFKHVALDMSGYISGSMNN